MNAAKVELGERLFSDGRLSLTGQYSCAACHVPARAFTDGLARARGATGALHARNTPTLVNAAYGASLGWLEGAPSTLEEQHRVPLFNEHPIELGFGAVAEARLLELRSDPAIASLFARAFNAPAQTLELAHVLAALASYVRSLVYADSPFDRYVYFGEDALSHPAREGLDLFLSERAGCTACHAGFTLSGPVVSAETPDVAPVFHAGVRAPTLRNVALTAPYFHDGSLPTLEAVLDFYAADGHGRPVPLADAERSALLAFLDALTDRRWRPQSPDSSGAADRDGR
jgi:cytochrome c peroxidase